MNFVRDYILPRLKERSTYVGLVALATAFGIVVDPALVDVALAVDRRGKGTPLAV